MQRKKLYRATGITIILLTELIHLDNLQDEFHQALLWGGVFLAAFILFSASAIGAQGELPSIGVIHPYLRGALC